MDNQPQWITNAAAACMREWTNYLHAEAMRLFAQDGSHVNLLFCFNKESGLVSVDPVPPNVEHAQLNTAIMHAVNEHDLYGVIFIGESWMYFVKDKDHTAFQLYDGEMRVSDLNDEDKKEALIVRMENRDENGLTYLNEIIRAEDGTTLKDSKAIKGTHKNWFQ